MGYVNGTNKDPGANADAPAPVLRASTSATSNSGDGSTQGIILASARAVELTRFMPVMDIGQALERRGAIVEATQKLMQNGVDFGKVPGTDRDVLLQPGADKLCNLFGLVIQYEVVKSEEDWTGERHGGVPFFHYEIKGRAYRGDFLMGEGVGSCNAWESKYRYRKAERLCPQCGKANIRKSRDGGWYCWKKTDGCGATFADGDQRVESQETGRKINPDMPDVVNTVLKMAFKRAKVSTTINATSAAEFFTQDLEDQEPGDADPTGRNIDIGSNQHGTREAAEYVAQQKIEALRTKAKPPVPELIGSKSGEIKTAFAQMREALGETRYFEELRLAGVSDPLQLRSLDKVRALYRRLGQLAQEAA